jgi:type I restriction enzyme S subunit
LSNTLFCVANVQDGHVDLTEVSSLTAPAVAAGVTPAGDVLMTEGGDLDKLGRGTVWEGQIAPCLHRTTFCRALHPHKVVPHFLAYVTASRYGRDYFEATGKRTTNLAATNATKVGAFTFRCPPARAK